MEDRGKPGQGYPRVMRRWANAPRTVAQDEWLSQPQAADRLHVNVLRIGWLVACEHLAPAHNPSGEAGVTTASVDREIHWRATAGWGSRLRRLLGDAVRWL